MNHATLVSTIKQNVETLSDAKKSLLEYSYAHSPAEVSVPFVAFSILKSASALSILFIVKESSTKAEYCKDNLAIYKDSCVELFIQDLSNSALYHNFEANPLGFILAESGTERANRTTHSEEDLSLIKRYSQFDAPFKEKHIHEWRLFLEIPATLFGLKPDQSLLDYPLMGNIYKCGDNLAKPHWLSLFPVQTSAPDFHRPESFGLLV